MRKPTLFVLALLSAGAVAHSARAQSQNELLNMGKSALGGMLGSQNQSSSPKASGSLSTDQIVRGLKEALQVGTNKTVDRLGRTDGYFKDAAAHIPLPGMLAKAGPVLKLAGEYGLMDDLETRINRAAEAAAPKARAIVVGAINRMSFQDARGILEGPQDSATQYFKRETTAELTTAMKPVIQKSLSDVGAVKLYQSVSGRLGGLTDGFNLDNYVTGKALDGVFHYLAAEEAEIRRDPAKRTTQILKTVFAQ
jgi:hypothetical protein